MSMIDRFRRWFDYEKDAHAKVLRSLDSVPPDRREMPEFQRAVSIFAHIVSARRVWLFRLGQIESAAPTMFPAGMGSAEVAKDLQFIQERWHNYLQRLTDADLERVIEYQSLDAGRFQTRLDDILTQLFGHSWYHRGQIAMLVKTAGGEPAVTDFIYWCREPIG